MFNKSILIITIALLSITSSVNATHYMGGEITWECLSNGRYRFIMKLYRECAGINFNSSEVLGVANYPGLTSINMNRISQTDISPVCNPNPSFPHITCPSAYVSNMGAVEEHIYTSDVSYPNGVQLIGIPPPQGWVFYHADCCRNPCTNISNAPTLDWFLRAIMYSYNNQPADPCFDNSPKFAELPSTVICTGYPFKYNHNAWDPELDSLTFEWGTPLITINQPINTYAPGYNYTSPLPGPTHNPNNVSATIAINTGETSFTSYTQGAFVTVTKVTAYKCGVKVAEIFREMQIVLISCGNNGPPLVTAPFTDPTTGLNTLYIDTVWAGEVVNFTLNASDFDLLPDGNQQTLTISASGSQFGTGYTSTSNGCLNPPCASLSPPPPATGISNVSTNFNWQTTCSHINTNTGCGVTSNVYNFIIKAHDDFCPAPAISWKTITIVVMTPPVMPAPEIRCIKVNPNGSVTLNWLPSDTGNKSTFNSYHIYYSNNPTGPFTVIDSIFNYTTTTYTHTGVNANNQAAYYYIKTRSGCSGSVYSTPSQTASSIFLNVNNNGTGAALLTWNPIYNPLLPSSTIYYNIYREYPQGNWTLINTSLVPTYQDTITFCNALINYRVEIYDSSGCSSVSNINGDIFQDVTPPMIPFLDSISVDNITGQSILGWEASSSKDTEGYIIYQFLTGIWTPIDTIYGINNNFYSNPSSNPAIGYESYRIAAFDSCFNTSPLGVNQQTIHLNIVLDPCKSSIVLYWTPYINADPALGGYNIWVSENNSSYYLLDTVNPSLNSFTHTNLTPNSNYCYFIQAYDNLSGGKIFTSSSNLECIQAKMPKQPEFIYFKVASVEQSQALSNGRVKIECITDTSAYVSEYVFERATSSVGNFTKIGILPPSNQPIRTFYDNTAKINERSYYYRIKVSDSCGNTALISDTTRTIFLEVKPKDDFTNTLYWNHYSGWSKPAVSYNIYRIINESIEPILANVPFSINTYTDDVSFYTSEEGSFSYFVVAIEDTSNINEIADYSYSNIALALQSPKLFVPNAFIPDGINSIFKPVGVFIEENDYEMQIYNRWGHNIFTTKSIINGWNGKYKGELCPAGVYIYKINFRSSNGEMFEKHGTVTLIR